MTTFLLPILLLLTIVAALVIGVAAAYWVICQFLNILHPVQTREKQAGAPVLAPGTSGD
ncbi:MAG TPA: hypothetical protein VL240_12160 [Candidatus Binatia bacterium]|nr:hypothetical protein [Candidatus Binatia bacterium]